MLSMKRKLKVKTRAGIAPLIAVVCLWTVASACSGMKGASTSRERSLAATEKRELKADIVNPAGVSMGTVKFSMGDDGKGGPGVTIDANITGLVPAGTFHGMHIHANNNPASGDGCVAPSFASAGGHLSAHGSVHGKHMGDLPVLLALADGTARYHFVTDRFRLADLAGAVVIVHALADNYNNVPRGSKPDQYTANSAAAVTLTDDTGNSGDRIGCGVIK
jgi:superoxide dismutase, Cu-Zn family